MSYRNPDTGRMAAQQRENMLRFAGETATLWAAISAGGGNTIVGIEDTTYSAGRTITAHFYVARGFLPNVMQTQTPAGMMPVGNFLMNSEIKPGVDDTVVYQGTGYHVDGQPWLDPFTRTWITTLRRG